MIFRKGYRSVALLTASERYLQTRRRTTAFIDTCRALGITIEESHILSVPGNMAGGSMGAVQFCYLNNRPKMLFCESDSLALGALSAFQRLNISIPTDLEVLAISMLGQEETLYSLPSLSIIDLPNEKMASAAAGGCHPAFQPDAAGQGVSGLRCADGALRAVLPDEPCADRGGE